MCREGLGPRAEITIINAACGTNGLMPRQVSDDDQQLTSDEFNSVEVMITHCSKLRWAEDRLVLEDNLVHWTSVPTERKVSDAVERESLVRFDVFRSSQDFHLRGLRFKTFIFCGVIPIRARSF
jgi:hypothetical protein